MKLQVGGAFCIMLLVAGCSAGSAAPTPTPLPVTQTPTATMLPPFPTVAQLGAEGNPLTVVLVDPAESGSAPDPQSLSNALAQASGLAVEVQWVATYAEALDALCEGGATVAQLSAPSYLSAQQAGCGEALYQVERDGARAITASLVVPMGGASAMSGLVELPFCRIDGLLNDAWIAAMLTLQANGINPLSQLGPVVDASSEADVISLFADGACGASVFVEPVEGNLLESIHVLETLPAIPNDFIVIDEQLDAEKRAVLVDGLDEQRQNIAGLIEADTLATVDTRSLASFEALFEAADVDVLALAQ